MQFLWNDQLSEIVIPSDHLVPLTREPRPPAVTDVAAAAREALEHPFEFPALRRALTPEDRVAVVIEPNVPHTAEILRATLDHLAEARIEPASVTLVCPAADQDQSWIDDLPDEFQEVQVETHHPDDRKKLAYLATNKTGRRIYLNRSLVDADQSVVITRRRYDTRLGYAGGAGVLFPGLCEEETAKNLRETMSLDAPTAGAWKLRHEAEEAAYLLGAPFFVQVIEGMPGEVLHIVGGSLESCREGERLLNTAWHGVADQPADLVIATTSGVTFAQVAQAFFHASRVVAPGGRIVLLSRADFELDATGEVLRRHEDPRAARKELLTDKLPGYEAALLWAVAAHRAKLYLLSRLPLDVAEDLFTTPLDRPEQSQKLIAAADRVIALEDADRTIATLNK